MGGAGKTTAARRLARRYDLRLYSVDSYTYAHAERLPSDTRSFDEIWLDSQPRELADWFEDVARARWPLVLDDLLALPTDAPVLAEGPQLLPELVATQLASKGNSAFVVAAPDLHRALVTSRGSGLATVVRDPAAALENRIERDRLLAERIRASASRVELEVIEIRAISDTEPATAEQFAGALSAWVELGDRGNVAARRREENDARLRQWRSNAERFGDTSGILAFACECSRQGCVELVPLGLVEAEARRGRSVALLAHRD